LVVVPADLVAHDGALALLLDDGSCGTAALVGPVGDRGPLSAPVRVEGAFVTAAGNVFDDVSSPSGTFGGVLRVGKTDLVGLAGVAEELAELAECGRLSPVIDAEAVDLLLAGLVRAGVEVRAERLGGLRAERVTGQAMADAALRRLAEVDESRARLDSAVKADDGLFATYAVSSWARHLVPLAARLGVTPNGVTGISFGLAVIAATWFSAGDRAGLVTGAAVFYLSFVFDCVDGQLARYTRRFSPLGGWLDAISDRAKEWLVYAGLAAGTGTPEVWRLAVAAMVLLALRHVIDLSYAGAVADSARVGAAWHRPARPFSRRPSRRREGLARDEGGERETGPGAPDRGSPVVPAQGGPPDPPLRAPARSSRLRRIGYWARRVVVLPIGERTALICATAALWDARATFLALLGWGGVAALYTLAGRVRRSLT
jgi:phosphatidylglycerophosphate synthase